MALRRRLDELERKTAASSAQGRQDRGSPLADEVREIDRDIKRLGAEIAEVEASMTPEALAQSRAEQEESRPAPAGLSLEDRIRLLGARSRSSETRVWAEPAGGG